MTRSGVSCPGFDMGRSLDRISLAALLLIDAAQEPVLEAVNAWLQQQRWRSVSALQYREWVRLHELPAAHGTQLPRRPQRASGVVLWRGAPPMVINNSM